MRGSTGAVTVSAEDATDAWVSTAISLRAGTQHFLLGQTGNGSASPSCTTIEQVSTLVFVVGFRNLRGIA